MPSTAIVWFRRDLRLDDNPALEQACAMHDVVVPVFVAGPEETGVGAAAAQPSLGEPSTQASLGEPSLWWLAISLRSLDASLRKACNRLVLRRGNAAEELLAVARECGADSVYWNHRYEPHAVAETAAVESAFAELGARTTGFHGDLLQEPPAGEDLPLTFASFWRASFARCPPPQPTASPPSIPAPPAWLRSLRIEELGFSCDEETSSRLSRLWHPGEAGARATRTVFLDDLARYPDASERLDAGLTSRLSPHLAFGELGPRQLWHIVRDAGRGRPSTAAAADAFVRQLARRDFARQVLRRFPRSLQHPVREEFERMPWRSDEAALAAWQEGRTGYPIVDAAMRELRATGWMHERARTIAASFLVKDLMLPWQDGASWFARMLVDADAAANTLGWQQAAGCGVDAPPFTRVVDPAAHARKLDPDGTYVRRWLPMLAHVPTAFVHQPWKAPPAILSAARLALGTDYPHPIVRHEEARRAALEAAQTLSR